MTIAESTPSDKGAVGIDFRILLVHDRGRLRDSLVETLEREGYETCATASADETFRELEAWQPAILLIDLGADHNSGLRLCRQVTGVTRAPIVAIAPADQERRLLEALRIGAADYVTKPIDGRALVTRVHTTLARFGGPVSSRAGEVIELGPLRIEPSRWAVSVRGVPVRLRKLEYELLFAFASHPGETLTKKRLLTEVWGTLNPEDEGSLKVYIARLRRRIEVDPSQPKHLVTVRGVGYYFNPDGDGARGER